MSLGERIKEERIKKGLSQEELADKLNVSRQAVQKWEADVNCPSVDAIRCMACYFKIDIYYLIEGKTKGGSDLCYRKFLLKKPSKLVINTILFFIISILLLIYYFVYIKIINPYSYAKDGGYIHTGLLAYILGPDADKTPVLIFSLCVISTLLFIVLLVCYFNNLRKKRRKLC